MVATHPRGGPDALRILDVRSPAPRDAWRDVLARDPFALETQSPEWTDAMCRSRGYGDASHLYEFGDGRRAVVPLLRRTVGGVVALEASNPLHCGVGGVVAADGARVGEIAAVLADLNRRPALTRSYWPHPLQADTWARAWSQVGPSRATVVQRRAHAVDLDGGIDAVARRFGKATRHGVRHARRNGVVVECGTGGRFVDEFFDLMELATVRWGRIQHEPRWLALHRLRQREPRSKFRAMGRHLGERMQVWLARVDGRPVATTLVLRGTNAYSLRSAMDDDMRKYRANDLLQVSVIEDVCAAGCRYYYLGDSGWSESLAAFKERFGATPYHYAEYRSERLPVARAERLVKGVVKRAIGFKD